MFVDYCRYVVIAADATLLLRYDAEPAEEDGGADIEFVANVARHAALLFHAFAVTFQSAFAPLLLTTILSSPPTIPRHADFRLIFAQRRCRHDA